MNTNSLDERSQKVFELIVNSYIEDGEPVGSTIVSQRLAQKLSPATIRNVMAKLEQMGLLYSPHTSAGRLPTPEGLRLFVHGFLEVGDITPQEATLLDHYLKGSSKTLDDLLNDATTALSGLTKCTGLVMAPRHNAALRHIEFMPISSSQCLVVMVTVDGIVENRIIDMPVGTLPYQLEEAGNYLCAKLVGRTLEEAKEAVLKELEFERGKLHHLATEMVQKGLAVWTSTTGHSHLIVKGQSNLLSVAKNKEDIAHIQRIFETLEAKEGALDLLDAAQQGEGVQVFMGSDNPLFEAAGCSMITAPYKNADNKIIGAIGVVGPASLNYGRIIPMVNYTAALIEENLKKK